MFRHATWIALLLAVPTTADEPKGQKPPPKADASAPVASPRIHYVDPGPRITIVQTPATPVPSQPPEFTAPYAPVYRLNPVYLAPYSILPVFSPAFPTHNALLPVPNSLLPTPRTTFPIPSSTLPIPSALYPSAPGRVFLGYPHRRLTVFPRHTTFIGIPAHAVSPRLVPTVNPRPLGVPSPAVGVGIRKP